MNQVKEYADKIRAGAWFVGVAGAFLLGGGLSWWLIARATPPPLDAARARERAALLAEVRKADQQALTTAAVLDPKRGVCRIPIQDAMELLRVQWADPAAGRASLLARVAWATAPLPEPVNIYDQ